MVGIIKVSKTPSWYGNKWIKTLLSSTSIFCFLWLFRGRGKILSKQGIFLGRGTPPPSLRYWSEDCKIVLKQIQYVAVVAEKWRSSHKYYYYQRPLGDPRKPTCLIGDLDMLHRRPTCLQIPNILIIRYFCLL